MQPKNDVAHLVTQAQSVIRDLTTQLSEIQTSIQRQEALITSIIHLAEWEVMEEEPDVEELEEYDETAEEDDGGQSEWVNGEHPEAN